MTLQADIDTVFEGQAFQRPLFYSYPGGLRFELSEGGSAIEQFLVAHRKASAIPYDDRGMDVVGPNHELLSGLYFKHRSCLLAYDQETMAETFEQARTQATDRSKIP